MARGKRGSDRGTRGNPFKRRALAELIRVVFAVGATAAAFAVTERLKLEPSPISDTHVDKVFSPVCECESQAAKIEFELRRADRLRIAIKIDGREATIADREFPQGLVRASWYGEGVPDGVYNVVHGFGATGHRLWAISSPRRQSAAWRSDCSPGPVHRSRCSTPTGARSSGLRGRSSAMLGSGLRWTRRSDFSTVTTRSW